jgi:hypothetical protein
MPTRLEDVFGIRTTPILSYTKRDQVDGRFGDALKSDHHVIIYGSSKQGKTALRQTHLSDKDCIIVRCGPKATVETIYSSIVRQAGVQITTFETEKNVAGAKVAAKTGFKAWIPFLGGADAEVSAEVKGESEKVRQTEFIAYDFADAQAIAELLNQIKFQKRVVLENFHYLPEDVQKHLAFDLKTFHEINVRFVILGIWREADLLITYNHDLQDRLVDIPVEPWQPEDFQRLALQGCEHLNITIDRAITQTFIDNAYGNVGMFQEFLRAYCNLYGVNLKGEKRHLDSKEFQQLAMDERLKSQKVQLIKDLQRIAAQSRIRGDEPDPLLLPYYLTKVITTTPVRQLEDGIDKKQLLDKFRELHHRTDKETVRGSDVVYLLQRLPHYQRDMQPPLVYYDSNMQRLKIVDTRQFFVIANTKPDDILDEIPFPMKENVDLFKEQ